MGLNREQWDRLRAELVARVHDLAAAWLPSGSATAGKWLAGNVHDGPGRSLNLQLEGPKAGLWYDHGGAAEIEKSGDLVHLRALQLNCTDAEAGERLWKELGLDGSEPKPPERRPAPRAKDEEPALEPAQGVSVDDRSWEWAMERGLPGEKDGAPPVLVHTYTWADGSIAMYVLRYNRPTVDDPRGKEFRPLTPWIVDGQLRWKYRDPPGKLPLYRLPIIIGTQTAGVVVCEGEKAADAAARLLPAWVTTTPAHGAKSPQRSDWSPLAGRNVIVWKDNDPAGDEFAEAVVGLVPHARILDVATLAKRIGWDLRPKDDAADVPATTDASVESAFSDPPLLPAVAAANPGRPSVPPPPRSTPRPPPPPPPKVPPVDDDDGESAQRARTYKRVVASITHAIEESGIWPNALNGWRRKDDTAAETGDDELRADFLHSWRLDGRPGERLIDDAWEKVVRDMRAARRRELIQSMTGKPSTPAGLAALRLWVIATAIGCVDAATLAANEKRIAFLVDVMRQWLWCVKRYALGLPVERELMIVLYGKQASGKTWAIEKLAALWMELSLPITAAALTDDRQAQVLYRGLIARWDELEGAHKADVDALKRAVTSKTIAFRNLYSNAIQERQRTCSFIASTNLPVRQVIKDTTGGRRYVEIETPDKCDWATLNALDMRVVWEAVSETDACPIKPHLAELDKHQRALVHTDAVCAWLAAEEWDTLVLRSSDGVKTETVPGYMPGRGLTMHELARRHAHWAGQVRQSPVLSNQLGARLRQLGFADPVQRRAAPDRPFGRYYAIPEEILSKSAPWMGSTVEDDKPDPLEASLPT